jgi:hypothetical protein
MNKQMMWIPIVALAVGALGGYYYEKSKLTSQMMMTQSSLQKQLDMAKMKINQLMKAQTMGNGTMMHASPGTLGKRHTTFAPSGAMMEK